MNRLANWIRRRRIAWLERKADDLELEFAGSPWGVGDAALDEARRMRALAASLRV